MNDARQAVVIGAGLAGLSCAILLAHQGWRVTVLEQHTIPGGLMQRYRRGGVWFDTGFHLASSAQPGGAFRAIMAGLGAVLPADQYLAPDPFAQFVLTAATGNTWTLPPGLPQAEAALVANWPTQASALAAFFVALRGVLATNPWLFPLAEGAAPAPVAADLSVNDVLDRCGVTGEPRAVLGAIAAILALEPATCPFALYASFAGSCLSGSWRLAQGGDGIIQPLVQRCAALGVTIHYGSPATVIHHDGRVASAVSDGNGRTHVADLVVAAIHPAAVLALTGPDGFRPTARAVITDTPDGAGAFLLAVRLQRSAVELGRRHHLMLLADGGHAYVMAPDVWDATLPPCLEALVWLPTATVAAWSASTVGRRGAAYNTWKQHQSERLLAGIYATFPSLVGVVERSWTASPLTFRDYTGTRGGAAMGLSHDLGHLGTQPLSPRNKLRNLLLTGQNIHSPGVLGSLIGGCVTAGMVVGRDYAAEMIGLSPWSAPTTSHHTAASG